MTPVLNPQNLINTLMSMYHSNIRQVEHLQQANMAIRNDITNILLRTIQSPSATSPSPSATSPSPSATSPSPSATSPSPSATSPSPSATSPIPIQSPSLTPNTNRRNNRRNIFSQRELNLSSTINDVYGRFMEPVQIFPTQIQIENATRVVHFADIVRPINNSCPITMDTFEDNTLVSVIRECNHIFNTDALNNWFRGNCRCPVCRYDIRNYNQPRNANANANANANTNNTNTGNTNTGNTNTGNTNTGNTNTGNTNTGNTNTGNTNNMDMDTNDTNIIPNISNVQYDSNTDSITFDITNEEFYNNLTRLAMSRLNLLNNTYDMSGNNVYDASGNNTYDASGNNTYDPSGNNTYHSFGNNYYY